MGQWRAFSLRTQRPQVCLSAFTIFFLGRKNPCKLDIFLISLADILSNSRFGDVSCLFTVDFPSHHLSATWHCIKPRWSLVHLDSEHLLKFNII